MRRMALATAATLLLLPARAQSAPALRAGMTRAQYVKAEEARSGKLAGRRFDQIDTGHKAAISRAQYVKYYEARSAKLAAKRFERLDKDHNGVLEAGELGALHEVRAKGRRKK